MGNTNELVSRLSHELRTPLNAILGWVQIVRAGGLDPASLDRALETIERNVKRQAQLIADLVDVSRIATNTFTTESLRIPLATVVSCAVEAARPLAVAKGVALEASMGVNVGDVLGDAGRLQQVFTQLLGNALKFTPPGGRITIDVRRHDADTVVRITDSGEGIEPELLPGLFDRFWASRDGTAVPFHGLGLGLTLVQHLVRLHGGTVTASSEGKDRGAVFVVTLPRLAPTRASIPSRSDEPASMLIPLGSLTDVHVHVVEDDEDGRELLKAVLERCGARVTTSGSAQAALLALDAEVPDVLVSDIGLPGEDGYALIVQVRARSRERGGLVPAVALTAFVSGSDRNRALSTGFDAHIGKPIEPAAVCAVVAQLAGRGPPRPLSC